MNYIWAGLMILSVIFAVINGKTAEFTKAIFDGAKSGVEISLMLAGIIAVWLGMTQIIEDSGMREKISNFFRPVISKLFKGIPEGHNATSSITLNILSNMLGTGNAATALGIKAMNDLQTLNPSKETISFYQMLFVVINSSSIQLVPFTIIGLLSQFGSKNPTIVIVPILIATVLTTTIAITNLFLFRRFFK